MNILNNDTIKKTKKTRNRILWWVNKKYWNSFYFKIF
jgi:hypothetical protein